MSLSESSASSPCRMAEVILVFNKVWLHSPSMSVFSQWWVVTVENRRTAGPDYSPESHSHEAFAVIHGPRLMDMLPFVLSITRRHTLSFHKGDIESFSEKVLFHNYELFENDWVFLTQSPLHYFLVLSHSNISFFCPNNSFKVIITLMRPYMSRKAML